MLRLPFLRAVVSCRPYEKTRLQGFRLCYAWTNSKVSLFPSLNTWASTQLWKLLWLSWDHLRLLYGIWNVRFFNNDFHWIFSRRITSSASLPQSNGKINRVKTTIKLGLFDRSCTGLDFNTWYWEPFGNIRLGASVSAVGKIKRGQIDGVWWSSGAYIDSQMISNIPINLIMGIQYSKPGYRQQCRRCSAQHRACRASLGKTKRLSGSEAACRWGSRCWNYLMSWKKEQQMLQRGGWKVLRM